MNIHELKIWPEYFEAVASKKKTFDLRKNDRGFAIGDILKLKEWAPSGKFYTGREEIRQISYILEHQAKAGCAATFGLQDGYVILAFSIGNRD